MIFIRYLQLCGLIFQIIYFRPRYLYPRKPRGDIRNFARSFAMSYDLHEAGSRGVFRGVFRKHQSSILSHLSP